MSIFEKLFRARNKKESYVRAWVATRNQAPEKSDDLSLLFLMMMISLCSFFDKESRHPKSYIKIEDYSGDATLYEIGCYMLFRVGLYLREITQEHFDEIYESFIRDFIDLFDQALPSNAVSLFTKRLSGFAEISEVATDSELYHHHLSQLILRSKGNNLTEYDFKNEPVLIVDFFEDMEVKIQVVAWERAMLPVVLKNIKLVLDRGHFK